MRVIGELKDLSLIEIDQVNGWIINVFGLSAYYDSLLDITLLEEVIDKVHNNQQEVYINARKIIHEEDLEDVKQQIIYLEKLDVDYYIYSDMAFYELAEELGIVNKLIYQVNTYMTNAMDVNIMLAENYSVVLSTEISFEELKKIVKRNPKTLYIHAFGYYPLFHSRRELITNYQKYRGLEIDTNSKYDIVEELRDSHYPIEQNENGMVVYIDGAYCLDEEITELNQLHDDLNYLVLSKHIELNEYREILLKYVSGNAREIYVKTTKGLLYETSTLLKKGGE